MADGNSVLDKALQLQGEARRLDLGRKDVQQAERIAERVHTIRAALGELRGRADLARTLSQRTGARIDLSGLSNGHRELARKAAGGLPSNSAFNAAHQKIKESSDGLLAEILDVWRTWTAQRLEQLPSSRIAMLDGAQQRAARSTLNNLRTCARSADLTATDIVMFVTKYEGLEDQLAQAQDAPPALLDLLNRLNTAPLVLREVSDEQIALLRRYSMDVEIELRRRNS
ncbi:hypothetical protein [Spirillospora sp. CA-294931]|uniref:hypothetical protein n=1 Tax=Spirillospora sp. CA-294931 TaxID=3240042 RepID=UPI003D915ACF